MGARMWCWLWMIQKEQRTSNGPQRKLQMTAFIYLLNLWWLMVGCGCVVRLMDTTRPVSILFSRERTGISCGMRSVHNHNVPVFASDLSKYGCTRFAFMSESRLLEYTESLPVSDFGCTNSAILLNQRQNLMRPHFGYMILDSLVPSK